MVSIKTLSEEELVQQPKKKEAEKVIKKSPKVETKAIAELELLPPGEIIPEVSMLAKKIPRGPTPFIPEEPCCRKVCTILNREIDAITGIVSVKQEELKFEINDDKRNKIRNEIMDYFSQVMSMKLHAIGLKEKGGCECIKTKKTK